MVARDGIELEPLWRREAVVWPGADRRNPEPAFGEGPESSRGRDRMVARDGIELVPLRRREAVLWPEADRRNPAGQGRLARLRLRPLSCEGKAHGHGNPAYSPPLCLPARHACVWLGSSLGVPI